MRNKSTLVLNVILVLGDFVALVAAFVLAYALRVKIDTRPLIEPVAAGTFLKIYLLILPVWLLIFGWLGLYNSEATRSRLSELLKVFIGCLLGTVFIIVLSFLSHRPIFPARLVPLYGFALAFLLVGLERQIIHYLRHWFYRLGIGLKKVVIVGTGPIGLQVANGLRNRINSGYEVVGLIGKSRSGLKGLKIYRDLAGARRSILKQRVDEIVETELIGTSSSSEVMHFAHAHHIKYRFYPTPADLHSAHHRLSLVAGLPMIDVGATPLEGWGQISKRLFDIFAAGLGLIFVCPLLLGIAIAIKLSDRGPIFYQHRRLTRFGQPINIYKFRTMANKYSRQDPVATFKAMGRMDLVAEFQARHKVKHDPRVTTLGHWLRRSSFDELPQLWNVFKGELSLVGPRPITKAELERFGNNQAEFLAIKAGMTGLWQVSGRSDLSYDERVELELFYVQNWSLLLDIKILLKTIRAVLRGQGAS